MCTQEPAVCIAPQGKLRIVHYDARDHWPTAELDCDSIEEVRTAFDRMPYGKTLECRTYDPWGREVYLDAAKTI